MKAPCIPANEKIDFPHPASSGRRCHQRLIFHAASTLAGEPLKDSVLLPRIYEAQSLIVGYLLNMLASLDRKLGFLSFAVALGTCGPPGPS